MITKPFHRHKSDEGFTLVELLVVIAIVGILAGMFLVGATKARAKSQSTVCKNHLRQIGLAMGMYVADNRRYPPMIGGESEGLPFQTWADRLLPYSAPLNWTNNTWQCPTYIANGGVVEFMPPPHGDRRFIIYTGYSYNATGIVGLFGWPKLGLGALPASATPEPEVQAPSEMYTVADAREFKNFNGMEQPIGFPAMQPYLPGQSEIIPHAQGYNLLFGDGHVAWVKRNDYLFPPRTAHNWNRDNQPHPEEWAPSAEWAVQQ